MTIEKILQAWAVGGQKRFAFGNSGYTRGAKVYFLVHDVNKDISEINEYFCEALNGCDFKNCKLAYVIGSKTDIYMNENNKPYVAPANFIEELLPSKAIVPNIDELKSKIDKQMILLSNNDIQSVTQLYNYIAGNILDKFQNDKKPLKTMFMGAGGVGKTTTAKNLQSIGYLMAKNSGIVYKDDEVNKVGAFEEEMTLCPEVLEIHFQYPDKI